MRRYDENGGVASSSSSSGLGFTGALQIVFIILKLLGKIEWSWLWVLAPTWISIIIYIVIIIGLVKFINSL